MLHLEGERQFPQTTSQVWSKLADIGFLVKCIPDVAEVKEVTERTASLILRPGFSFIRGELQLTLEKVDETRDQAASFLARTKGIGSTTLVEAAFTLAAQSEATQVKWSANVKELGGLLKAVPRGLIQAAAQKVINDLLAGVERQMAAAPLSA
jgi:carbon monoxide dehydrogenase subunit G